MVRSGLVARIAGRSPHLSEAEIDAVVSAILQRIGDALTAGDRVELRGFGVFAPFSRRSHSGLNPYTKRPIQIGDRRLISFKPAKSIKRHVEDVAARTIVDRKIAAVRLRLNGHASTDASPSHP
ncbi:HU family DNA-binding protein [Methylobacterium goesingense]|uniref:Integration host factor subunit beta n=1 Tax=Methylobacterium goesingense TaxID=243690 RepID=A0ABV2L316_9HYPH|nr:HU family DNA-binding protein [Methylobacterium goesingense]GJD76399.1 Integration host factor subunit beta [Methylobacterium goesingense]